MITLETHFQTLFGHWLKAHKFKSVCELKISSGNTVAFSKFQDQQLPSLWQAYKRGLYVKLTDASLGLKPFDCLVYKGPAYVVIMFNIPETQKEFYIIHIKDVVRIKESGAKSVTKKDCEKYGEKKSLILAKK